MLETVLVKPNARCRARNLEAASPPASLDVERARALPVCHKVIVAGTEITPQELEASEWLTQVYKSREARTSKGTTIPPASDTQDGRSSSHKTSNASNDDTAATDRSLTPRQRGRRLALNSVASKQPRLPSDVLKLIVRPRGGLLLSKITNFILFEAVCTAANFAKASVRGEDLIQVNSKQNTFAYCTPAVERAERVLRLKELVIGTHTYEISVYCAPDESQGRGVIRGVDLRLDHQDHIRILGLHRQANGGNSTALQLIDQSAIQIGRLFKRVANKHAGMRESNLLRLVQAFVCTRITYVAPYLRLTRTDLDRLNVSLRKAYKTALGLPMSTSTSKLLALGVSNTVNELIEATLTSQYQRLSLTHAGRAVLHQIGLIPTRAATTYQDIPTAQRLSLPPLPQTHAPRTSRGSPGRPCAPTTETFLKSLRRHLHRRISIPTSINNGGCRLGPTPRLEHGMQCILNHKGPHPAYLTSPSYLGPSP
ncbi:hypothetical protein MTO96_027846 [Rhipicephalus appendiculatus]